MKRFVISILSVSVLTFTGCFGESPDVPNDENREVVEVVEDEIIEENIELIDTDESNENKTTHELGNELLLSLIDYYTSVYKLRSVGLENVSDADAQMVNDLRKSIDKLILGGADVNYRDEEGNTPIYISVINNDKQILEKLIEKGAALDTKTPDGHSLLSGAIIEGSLDSANTLLDKGTDPDGFMEEAQKPLNIALLKGIVDNSYISLAEKLVTLGAEPNIRGESGDSILLTAIKMKNRKLASALIKNGADINFVDKNKISTLNWAIIMEENDTAKNIITKDRTVLNNRYSLSPLLVATVVKNDAMYEYLKGEGLELNKEDKGWASMKLTQTLGEKDLQNLLNGETTVHPKPKKVVMKDANVPISNMKFLSINESGDSIKVFSDDNLQKKFTLQKPFRVVLDFTRFSGARNYSKNVNGKNLYKVRVGRHESFYRVVLYVRNSNKATIKQQDDGVKVTVK